MEVITTHINADFDALASMIAAKKLYPEAALVFPGSQEKTLRRFFLESVFYIVPFEKVGKIDLEAVRRLILVDIRQKDRIGRFADLVDSPDVEVHIYDHHPPTDQDIKGHVEHFEPVGASVSILVRLLREQCLPVTPEEATIMMMGIYEDTGCLTFSSTAVADFEAAAWLLECGADLNAVSYLITSELTQDQLSLLNDLAQSAKVHTFSGIDVNVAEASADGYVGDLAVLVHKLRDMENLDVLFVLARMENRVFVVGRSRIPEVDAGDIMRAFGGGGHAQAASATIKDLTLFQIREQLLTLLSERIKPLHALRSVRELMSHPVICLQADDTVSRAIEILARYNINSFPVLRDGKLCGKINRQVVEKASHHGLGERQVSEIMTTDYHALQADDVVEKAYELLLTGQQRFTPVMEEGELVGVLTRMDVLQAFARSLPAPIMDRLTQGGAGLESRVKRVGRLMKERLSAPVFKLVREMGETADELGMQAYVVGGVVRDLVLRRNNLDMDIVVEGDGLKFAERICERYQARRHVHERFGTANVVFPDGFRIDVATARLEYYDKPAALPNVEWSSLKLDLYRRDFTMNSLAVCLNPGNFGQLVDFFGGQKDIKDKVIRVIQNLSFIEDPTRIFRGLRFSERFGFAIGAQTKYLMNNAVQTGILDQLEGRRLLGELMLILREENPKPILRSMQEMGLLRVLHPDLVLDSRLETILDRAWEVGSWFRLLYLDVPLEEWLFYILCLTALLDDKGVEMIRRRLDIKSRKTSDILRSRTEAEKAMKSMASTRRKMKPSLIHSYLHSLPTEALLYMMTKTTRERTRQNVSLFITKLRSVAVAITGKDLRAMGYPRGPQYREIIDKVLGARLDGHVTDLASEKAWVARHFPLKK